jgi:alkanesulfonate monooxygenase SsuD/methylene tetrahydromethanopterin reductase-like flavin-dependent oxidoreductase (luciferase family)
MGEQKTLRLVAQYADACNFFFRTGEEMLKSRLDTLKQHCERLGRPYEAIEKTALNSIDLSTQSTAEIVDTCRQAADLGFTHMIFNMPNVHEIWPLEKIAKEIIPAVADL